MVEVKNNIKEFFLVNLYNNIDKLRNNVLSVANTFYNNDETELDVIEHMEVAVELFLEWRVVCVDGVLSISLAGNEDLLYKDLDPVIINPHIDLMIELSTYIENYVESISNDVIYEIDSFLFK